MREIVERDIIAAIGPTDDLIVREALRTGASQREFRRALAFVEGSSNADPKAYHALTNRLRRLVDLLSVASSVPRRDVGALRAALTLAAKPEPVPDLKALQVAGPA